MEAREAVLANPADSPPHLRARLLPLIERLRALGVDDEELTRFAATLVDTATDHRSTSRRR